MRQDGFAALRTRAPLRLRQTVMRPPLVFDSFRSSSFWYRHFDPILPAGKRQNNVQGIGSKLAIDFERPKNRKMRVGRRSGIAGALFNIEIHSTTATQSSTIFTTQRAGRQGQ
jgi:hypothetical protein